MIHRRRTRRLAPDAAKRPAFTLVELLTVVFIISLLIGILVPSLSAARTAAKKAVSAKALKTIDVGLEMFKNDNASDFRQTNGYPPSFAHPPIPGYTFNAYEGQFPFLELKSESNPPVVYGAHWLPAMLMGVDHLGYVQKGSVPTNNNLKSSPWLWYTPNAAGPSEPIKRTPLYIDPGNTETIRTKNLPGREPLSVGNSLFPNWDDMNELPVIVDGFDYPILYYVANKHGRTTNMVADKHRPDNDYSGGGAQDVGVPYYFHQDNEGFTGNDTDTGWDFDGVPHAMGKSGADLSGRDIVLPQNRDTFARWIIDRKVFKNFETMNASDLVSAPLKPVNAESYILISPGADGRYGSNDDVSNMPPFTDD